MEITSMILAMVVAFFVGRPLFGLFFEDGEDFWDCVKFSFTPDLFSLFRGQYFEDMAKSFKLSAYFLVVGGGALLTYFGAMDLLGRWLT